MIIRQSGMHDIDGLVALAANAGKGMTTMPRDRDAMAERVAASVRSFATDGKDCKAGTYLLVLEESDGSLSGISAVYTGLGHDQPFYSYRLSRLASHAPEIGVKTEATVLSLVNDFHGFSELGTLYLDPERRGGGRGRLLSYCRFLMIAAMPERFGADIMAEMRGWTDASGASPFWEAVGRKFFKLDFERADILSGTSNRFIADLMPKVPIYTELLPDAAQAVIGKTHDQTMPARRLLEAQGFRFRNQVDVFDAGPCMEARSENIPLVRDAQETSLAALDDGAFAQRALVASLAGDFRVVATPAVREQVQSQLEITASDPVLYARF